MAGPQIIYRVAAHLSQKGSLVGDTRKTAAAVGGLADTMRSAGDKATAFGRSQVAAVTSAAASMAKFGAAVGGAGLAAGIGFAAVKGAEFNATMERSRNTIAGTLQLYNHSANAADQMGQNMKVAAGAMMKIQEIADAAPGDLTDITTMFQNMLPGARSVTGDMQRIVDLSQSLAMFTPTLTGGDFQTSGAQMSRILTGSAGAEMDTWKRLAPVILNVGKEMDKLQGHGKVFGKDLNDAGEKLTLAFNKLDSQTRFGLVEKAFAEGGPALAKMYESSWEGASASFISGWRKIAGAGTQPMFESMKEALIRANKDGGAFSKKNQESLTVAAQKIGGLLNQSFVRMLDAGARGISHLADNWEDIANRVYHAMQIGAGLIKGAFAYGATRMAIGAAAMAAGGAMRAGSAGIRGARSGFGMLGKGVGKVKGAVGGSKIGKSISAVFDALTHDYGSLVDGVERKSKLWGRVGTVFTSLAAAGVILVPMLLVASVALGALALVLVGAAGIAVYLTSKWKELSASVVDGFNNGTVTLRPLVVAAMILWERLKKVGEALIGGATGATMMQGAINLAASAINGVSQAVGMLAELAAGFIRFIGKGVDMYDSVFGENRISIMNKRKNKLMEMGMTGDKAEKTAMQEYYDGKLTGPSASDRADSVASQIESVAKIWSAVDLKDLNLADIDTMTSQADDWLKALFAEDGKTRNAPKGPSININTLVQEFDLRNEDPDRAMVAWVEPIANLARNPVTTELDIGGF